MPQGFRSLEIWQSANALAIEIYQITKGFPAQEKFSLTDQIQRAATSVSANIAEGCGRYGVKDKIQFLMVARGSIYETQSHLSIAQGLLYIKTDVFTTIDSRYETLIRQLNAFVTHLRKTTAPVSAD
jgi:four helix bundle protein